MIRTIALTALTLAGLTFAHADETLKATLYKNPQCGCCEGYADYLRKNGFEVDVRPTNDLAAISSKAESRPTSRLPHDVQSTAMSSTAMFRLTPSGSFSPNALTSPDFTLPGMPMDLPAWSGKKPNRSPFTPSPRTASRPVFTHSDE